ncbi:ATP-binding protein [Sphingobacterium kyonggiense]|uniref:histidine kinase n=1 Tax=Sphingobacterium kyonggiense TaxID=714075 RepID=A0ABP7YN63_9SPHI
MDKINCEDEQIQFLGTIQNVGFLIISNKDGQIEAVSDNISEYISTIGHSSILNKNVAQIIFPLTNDEKELHNIFNEISASLEYKRSTQLIELNGKSFYLSLSNEKDKVYLEFEYCISTDISKTNIMNNKLINLQNEEQDVWKILTEIISKNLEVDRVMVYQFNEDRSGVVIAETLMTSKLDSYLGLNYPEFDIPKQARELYKTKHCRFIVDTDESGSKIISESNEKINLQEVSIRRLSPIHLQYLKNAGFRSSISFSIIIRGELWGLVCCQHESPKHIDLAIRNFALMTCNFAANKHQQLEDREEMSYLNEVQTLELQLKEKLLLKSNIFLELKTFSKELMDKLNADGIAISYDDSIYQEGLFPNKEILRSQFNRLNQLANNHVFTTHELFKVPEINETFEKDIAGLAFIEIDHLKNFYICWFRKEIIIDREWAGKPEKHYQESNKTGQLFPSPRTSFEVWKEQVNGSSKKWSLKHLHFLARIRELIRDSLLNKAAEIEMLNSQLIEMNNALDTYAYTISHDLKNPLSAIKISTEFLQYKKEISPNLLQKMSSNILESVQITLNMLDKIHQFSKANAFYMEKETIEPENFINEIIDNSKYRYGSNNVEIVVQNLLPVQGEKTLLYQLFLNLIGNAIKYSSKSESAKVIIGSVETDNGVIYTISDNGIGIDEKELETIYQMFKRMSNSTGFEGSGIGMSIVKRIADKLDIDISISSKINQGTTVKLMFPFQ